MDFDNLKNKANFFSALKGLSKKDKIRYLTNCPPEAVETICEACFNLLKHHKLKHKKCVLTKIKPIHGSIKKLGNKSLTIEKKLKLLDDSKVVCGLISAIGESILPLINSIIKESKPCKKKKKKEKKAAKKK